MALTDERLKEIEGEVGSQPYSVVLGLVFEIRYLRKELKESREAALDEAATKALEQRCERGTPWDLACTTIASEIRALKSVGVNQAAG